MIVVLADRQINAVVNQLSGTSFTSEELEHQPALFQRFNAYLREFGVELQSAPIQLSPTVWAFRVILRSDNLEQIAEGLQLLSPLNVTIEREDLVPLGCPLAVPHWAAIQPHLQRLSLPVANLLDNIEAAMRDIQPTEWTPDTQGYEQWSIENDIPLPGAGESELRAQRFAREAEARRAAANERIDRRDNTSRFHVREIWSDK